MWEKDRSKPHPDLTIKVHMEETTEVFNRVASEAKYKHYRTGRTNWENAGRFTFNVYGGFQRNEQTLAVAVDLEDLYNRVQFKLLIEFLMQYGVSLTLTR